MLVCALNQEKALFRDCEKRWIVCSSRHDRLEAGCGDPYKVETHHALVYRSIVSGPPALQQLGYLHSIHYWARASNCFGLFAGEHRNSRHTRVLSRARVTPCLRRGRHLSRLAACSASPLLLLDTCSMQCTNIINNPTIRTRNTDNIYFSLFLYVQSYYDTAEGRVKLGCHESYSYG